ncbi:Ulp1 family isopeptidase [Candidatus Tisiphia endosymbiont of Micropterix aruncella]|uniref:Ulp1 family isopeptidase n=1 Tax=Candidatus Tisiphia endosymbiont of Micropterix aruncella TaxID=3066271 RepID=UPI003AA817C7
MKQSTINQDTTDQNTPYPKKINVIKVIKDAFQDQNFRKYYQSFHENKKVKDIQESFKNLRTRNNPELIKSQSRELEQEIKKINEEFKDNEHLQEFRKLYEGKSNVDVNVINSFVEKEYKKTIGNTEETTDSTTQTLATTNLVTEFRVITGNLKKPKDSSVCSKLKENKEIELTLDDLKNLRKVYELYNKVPPEMRNLPNFKQSFKDFNINQIKTIVDPQAIDTVVQDRSWYTDDQMRIIGKSNLAPHCDTGSYQYIERLTYTLIDKDFVEHIRKEDKPIFISCNVNNNHWIAICILKNKNGVLKVLFKDPLGHSHKYIFAKIKEEFGKVGINDIGMIFDQRIDQKDSYNCGPMTLHNLVIIAKTVKEKGNDYLIDNFRNIEFCNSRLAHQLRKEHNKILNEKTQEERVESRKLLDEVKRTLNIADNELKPLEKILDIQLENGKNQLLKLDNAIKLDIGNEEAKKLKSVILYKIAEQHFKSGYIDTAHAYIEKSILANKANDLAKLLKKGIKDKLVQNITLNGEKTQEELLREIKQNGDIDNEQLKNNLNEIKKLRAKYENYTKEEIKEWATKEKENWLTKGKNYWEDDKSKLLDYIAIIDRANYIDTFERTGDGHHLRDTQILSILSCFNCPNGSNGRLNQVSTGEGKSTIVSVLAIIKALQGKKVDILTSSHILAERDAKEKAKLYELFNLTVSDNGVDLNYVRGEKECYKTNILYGSISNF